MELICGARLEKADIEIINKAKETPEKIIEHIMIKSLENIESEFIRDHVSALGWMVANDRIRIKVAKATQRSISRSRIRAV